MQYRYVDLVALGVSVSTLSLLASLGTRTDLRTIAIDIKPRVGGLLSTISTIAGPLPLIPVVLGTTDAYSDAALKLRTETIVVKEGDYSSKVCGYEDPSLYQEPWFEKWRIAFKSGEVAITLNVDKLVPKLSKPRIVTNVRRIYTSRRIIALSNGIIVKYRILLSAWPLDILLRKLDSVPNRCASALQSLRSVAMHGSIIIERSNGSSTDSIARLYIHGTRASRFHTAVKIPLGTYIVTYVFTSYSSSYPLMPGIIEKIFSEMKRFKIIDTSRIVDERHYSHMYATLSKPTEEVEECLSILEQYDIMCLGRLGLWREASVNELVNQGVELARQIRKML